MDRKIVMGDDGMAEKNIISRRRSKVKSNKYVGGSDKVYTLDVYLIGGPVTKEFDGKEISRRVQLKGNQTLKDLHREAFDRWDEHLYEFNLGEGPYDRSAVYSLPDTVSFVDDEKVGDVAKTTIESLGLTIGRAFGYWFDFGDDWLHQINVVAIDDQPESSKYPKIIKRVGETPPQYPDFDDESEIEEE